MTDENDKDTGVKLPADVTPAMLAHSNPTSATKYCTCQEGKDNPQFKVHGVCLFCNTLRNPNPPPEPAPEPQKQEPPAPPPPPPPPPPPEKKPEPKPAVTLPSNGTNTDKIKQAMQDHVSVVTSMPEPEIPIRDWFAGQALIGLISGRSMLSGRKSAEEFAKSAYDLADAMVNEKRKRGDK
jgi:hypothetical protein